jgi:hypothetical protein
MGCTTLTFLSVSKSVTLVSRSHDAAPVPPLPPLSRYRTGRGAEVSAGRCISTVNSLFIAAEKTLRTRCRWSMTRVSTIREPSGATGEVRGSLGTLTPGSAAPEGMNGADDSVVAKTPAAITIAAVRKNERYRNSESCFSCATVDIAQRRLFPTTESAARST